MGMIKVLIAFVLIAILESITNWKHDDDKRCFEIAMSILMAAWIARSGW